MFIAIGLEVAWTVTEEADEEEDEAVEEEIKKLYA